MTLEKLHLLQLGLSFIRQVEISILRQIAVAFNRKQPNEHFLTTASKKSEKQIAHV